MRTKHLQSWVAVSALTGFFLTGAPARAQSANAQDNRPAQDTEFSRQDLVNFNLFLDSHRETADRLRKQPDLIENQDFLNSHPDLQNYLQYHQAVRDQILQNPNAFMAQEDQLDAERGDNPGRDADHRDADRRDLAEFNRFLDTHRETAEQLRKQPDLVENGEFLKGHPELQDYLQQHPGVREQILRNPNAFMAQEDRFDNHDNYNDRDRDANHEELANFDRFLDTHRETAEQLRRHPDLAENQEFLTSHPALQAYLQQHPGVRDEIRQNPNAFMQEEARYDRPRPDEDRDSFSHRQFGEFLGSHADITRQLTENPALCKDHDYLQNHPELRDYLSSHPEVQQRLTADPQNFVKSAQQFNTNPTPGQTVKPPAPVPDATKPKQ
ncbi:MAG: hypothetical protein WCC15_21125 [Candidatus Acidiferrales bacterium]